MLLRFRVLAIAAMVGIIFLLPSSQVWSQKGPTTLREFLARYTGKEILLLDKTSNTIQFAEPDSAHLYVVVLDEIRDDAMIVHRATESDKRTFSYPIADIRRITYLFNKRPYRRIVVSRCARPKYALCPQYQALCGNCARTRDHAAPGASGQRNRRYRAQSTR